MRSGRLPPPPKTLPVKTVLALKVYQKHERSTSLPRRRWLAHQLLYHLDGMTPLQLAAYYHTLQVMRLNLNKNPCKPFLHGWCRFCGQRCFCYGNYVFPPKKALVP